MHINIGSHVAVCGDGDFNYILIHSGFPPLSRDHTCAPLQGYQRPAPLAYRNSQNGPFTGHIFVLIQRQRQHAGSLGHSLPAAARIIGVVEV